MLVPYLSEINGLLTYKYEEKKRGREGEREGGEKERGREGKGGRGRGEGREGER